MVHPQREDGYEDDYSAFYRDIIADCKFRLKTGADIPTSEQDSRKRVIEGMITMCQYQLNGKPSVRLLKTYEHELLKKGFVRYQSS